MIKNPPKRRSEVGAQNDEEIVAFLSEQLGTSVRLQEAGASSDPRLYPEVGQTSILQDQPTSVIRIGLPSGATGLWRAEHPELSAHLARSLFNLQQSRVENSRLRHEVDSLSNHVSRSLEELSLIRDLATSSALPTGKVSLSQVLESWLEPLRRGTHAEAVVGVIQNHDGTLAEPMWSGSPVASKRSLFQLIKQHKKAVREQAVLRNQINDSGLEGIEDYLLVQCCCSGKVHGWVLALNYRPASVEGGCSQTGFSTVQASLMDTLVSQLATQLHNLGMLRQKETLLLDTVRALVNALDARDPYTCGHSERVALFAKYLAKVAGLRSTARDRIYLTGLLHDVGKIAIPDMVLLKPSKLNDEERRVIQTHTDAGWRILHELEALKESLSGVLYHHENYDGSGYPDGLIGDNIPLDGRILAVCDAFDAMTSDRPYRRGMSVLKAAEILKGGAGRFWDPRLVELFLRHLPQIDKIRKNHQPRKPRQRMRSKSGKPMLIAIGSEEPHPGNAREE